MKYKVGDKVKVIKPSDRRPIWDAYMSEIFPEYQKYWKDNSETKLSTNKKYLLIGSTATCSLIQDVETKEVFIITTTALELVKPKQLTKSDLKDHHIVVQRSGYKALWKDIAYKKKYKENLSHKYVDNYSINEVWEFDKLVWKREEQILDEVEKKYLSDLIRPFRDKVRYIRLINYVNTIKQFISIEIKGDSSIYFPLFKKGTMYKGMEVDKNYSLEDLGL